ncbi:MAG: glutathione S-transferase family protein [bacterium]|nr:glutathione S-transferase family protein [bacterium]
MNELILHHYEASPYSEKIRTILGFKGLAYRSVLQPQVLPKPDQLALTGGYRKAPLLQIGAHIYCDTNLIADVLERLKPEPTLYPAPVAGASRMIAAFADQTLFRIAAMLVFQPQGGGTARAPEGMSRREMVGLLKDRTKMMQDSRVIHVPPDLAPTHFDSFIGPLEVQLGHEGPYICGPSPSIADFASHHVMWFIQNRANVEDPFAEYPRVKEWIKRIDGFRQDPVDQLESAAAVELAKKTPPPPPDQALVEHPEWKAGDTIEIVATDYGFDPVQGELVKLVGNEIALRRIDERAGEVIVHFPVVGYEIRKPA